jgi:ABC-type molybdate transport system substrate-binding protein
VAQSVATGQADAGVVYRTDVTPDIAAKVRIIKIPRRYDVIASNYAAVPAHAGDAPVVRRFIAWIASPAGQRVLEKFGYLPVKSPS